MHCVSFVPWFVVENERTVGDVTLLPYVRGQRPGGTKREQRIIDRAASAFLTSHPGRPKPTRIERATVVRFGADALRDLDADERGRAFDLTEILATSAIAGLKYFQGHSACNREGLRVYVQRLPERADRFWTTITRRRGGSAMDITSRRPVIVRESHVHAPRENDFDWDLLAALMKLRAQGGELWQRVADSLLGFNAANTDSSLVSEGHEAIAVYGAMQRLFDVSHRVDHLVPFVVKALKPLQDEAPSAELKAQSKGRSTVREAWIRDFALVRNAHGHGKTHVRPQPFWSISEHLLLAAVAFPLMLKRELEGKGLYRVTGSDRIEIEAFEARALHRPLRAELWGEDGERAKGWHDAWAMAAFRIPDRHLAP